MPRCRVLRSFEPAFAGGPSPRNAALAQAYRVVSVRLEPYMGVLVQNLGATSRTPQNYFDYTMTNRNDRCGELHHGKCYYEKYRCIRKDVTYR